VFGVGDEFVDEDVVVGCVADGAADDADGEGEGGDGGDEVLWGGLVKRNFGGGIRYLGEPTSGQMMVVMIEAGTTIPPMPMPARTRRPQTW